MADVISQIRNPQEVEQLRFQSKALSHFIIIMDNPDAIWADRRSSSAQTMPVVRQPESTATLSYLGRFN